MDAKLLEIRDRATFLPVLCVLMESEGEQEQYLLRRSGFAEGSRLVLMAGLNSRDFATSDTNDWANRTRTVAHEWITKNWDSIAAGDVIDVEFILGESKRMKVSERFDRDEPVIYQRGELAARDGRDEHNKSL